MTKDKAEIQGRIKEIEEAMLRPDFWQNKTRAQNMMRELQELKNADQGVGKFDRGGAVLTIYSGAGGDDAEDWSRMLFDMYLGFARKKNLGVQILYENQNDHGGYRTITFEVTGKNVYSALKNEAGVHRLVRISPFNSQGKRQTSFSMVEVLPRFEKGVADIEILEDEIEIEFTKSSGPGGQNVNKRETAVRVKHKPTGATVFVSTERSQAQNKEKALEILRAKIYTLRQKESEAREKGMSIASTTQNEWGSQIRSYVLHPYKLAKDHRTNTETSNIEAVLSGDIDLFIEAMKQ